MLNAFIERCLPAVISLCEGMGIFIVAVSAVHAFFIYCKGLITHTPRNIKPQLASDLAAALEFKMAAEILKTVLVRQLEELLVLGAVILLRALLSLLIHIEMRGDP